MQRIQIKIATDAPPGLLLDSFLAIFGRWRMDRQHPAEWVDVADYAHMSRGPGIMLIGKRCNFSFDLADPGPGILYASKKDLTGSHLERMNSAMQGCLEMTRRLLAEEEFPSGVRLRTDSLKICFNDRLETPNTSSTNEELRPAIRQFLDTLFGAGAYELTPQSDPRQCYGLSIKAKQAEPLDVLLERVSKASVS